VAPTITVAGLQVTATEVTLADEADCTETDAVPESVAFCVLSAITVTLPAVAGAVKRPLELMVPELADHLTAEL
jgi:hypothetical protein